MSRKSVFCLQPPGDMPTRKSLFDCLLSGCIPVLFHPLTARFMYEWHLGQSTWNDIAIHFDSYEENNALINDSIDYIDKLYTIYKNQPSIITSKQSKIKQVAYQIQYSLIIDNDKSKVSQIPGESDAYDISITKLLKIHSGLEKHDRVSDFVVCEHHHGHKDIILQTTDWCNQTFAKVDPFKPSSVSSPLYYKFSVNNIEQRKA